MSLPFFEKDHTGISNHVDFPGGLSNLPASRENYILVAGPDLVRREAIPGQGHARTYLERLLKGMVVWCTQNKVIRDQDIIHDLHILLHNGALVPLAYRLEEYLAAAQLKEQCLREVLNPYSQAKAIHYQLTRLPFRGYVTTSYDTCIETAYEETQQGQLSKFYQSSLAGAVEASQKKQPFILKLYGDLAKPDSIKLGHRLLTGLYAEDVRRQLRQLFCDTPHIFISFDDADQDLIALQSLAIAKDEQSEKKTVPDSIIRNPARVPAFNGQYKGNERRTGSRSLHSGSTSGSDHRNSQPFTNNLNPAPAPPDKPRLPNFNSFLSSRNFQLPDTGVLGTFKSALRNKGVDLNINLDNKPGEIAPLGRAMQYTRVTRRSRENEEDVRALIYIPGSTIRNPGNLGRQAIIGLCSEFPPDMMLIICTDTERCDTALVGTVQLMRNRKIEPVNRIEYFLNLTNKNEQLTWIDLILDYKSQ